LPALFASEGKTLSIISLMVNGSAILASASIPSRATTPSSLPVYGRSSDRIPPLPPDSPLSDLPHIALVSHMLSVDMQSTPAWLQTRLPAAFGHVLRADSPRPNGAAIG